MIDEPCVDARLTLGAALGSAAAAAVSLAWGSPVAAIAQAVAGLVLAALAIRAARQPRPTPGEREAAPRSSAVDDAIATLTGAGGHRAAGR